MAVNTAELSAELWQKIAGFCVHTHELRTVYSVFEDLSSLQCVCKSSAKCAADNWSSVAQLCQKRPKKLAENAFDLLAVEEYLSQHYVVTEHRKLAKAASLPQEKLTVYLLLQVDSVGSIKSNNAKRVYHLTDEELQTCKRNRQAQLFNSMHDSHKGNSKKQKHSKDNPPSHCSYDRQVC